MTTQAPTTVCRGIGAVLHVTRVRGPSTAGELERALGEDPGAGLAALEAAGLLAVSAEHPPRWRVTRGGRERADLAVRGERETLRKLLGGLSVVFLSRDREVKKRCTRWQDTGDGDGAVRWDILADLGEVVSAIEPAATQAVADVPRFGAYVARLRESLELARNDPRAVTSPLMDSFHSVWFECHEDLVLCLDLERAGD